MTTYVIDYADPLRDSFSIPAQGFNGPGGASHASTLRLYGRGALEWGEAVDENMLRLAENFAGATPPLYPLGGQLWLSTKFYWKTSAGAVYRYDPDGTSWTLLSAGTGANQVETYASPIGSHAAGTLIGQYVYSTPDGKLYRWDSAYKQVAASWMERVFTLSGSASAPTTQKPEQALKVWNAYTTISGGDWASPLSTATALTAPPDPQVGGFWYDTTTNTLNVWTGAAWHAIVLNGSLSSDFDMNGHKIINMADPTLAQDAATKNYVDTQLGGSTAGYGPATYVAKAGSTMTGPLILSGAPTINLHAATKLYVDTAVAGAGSGTFVLKAGDTMSGLLILSGAPVTGLGAATKTYVDTSAKWQGATKWVSSSAPNPGVNDIGSVDGDVWFKYV